MTNKLALQIVVAEAVKACSGQEPVIVYTTAELKQAIYRANKHIKFEVS